MLMHPSSATIDRASGWQARQSSRVFDLRMAQVLDATPPWFVLDASPRALRAPSCLLVPRVGDVVLVCIANAPGPATIIAVIESGAAAPAELGLPPSATIMSPGGTLSIRATEIRMVTAAIVLTAGRVTTRARLGVHLGG